MLNEQTSGQQINNDIQEVVRKFSELTGIPVGVPESHALFALWKEGRFEELSNRIMINSANAQGGSAYDQLSRSVHRLSLGHQQKMSELMQLGDSFSSLWTK